MRPRTKQDYLPTKAFLQTRSLVLVVCTWAGTVEAKDEVSREGIKQRKDIETL